MTKLLLVGAGGFLGSILRYVVGSFVQQLATGSKFPYGTLTVNLLGCSIIGYLAYLAEGRAFGAEAKAFIFVGVLGGFTTFSSFGNETVDLWRTDHQLLAMANIAGHFILCLTAVCLGRGLAYVIHG